MDYKKMVEQAQRDGVATTDKMWQSIKAVGEMMESVPEEVAKRFARKQHEILYGCHYDQQFAADDLEAVHYTDRDGYERNGAHWSADDVEEAMKGVSLPASVTKWDKWVAANVMYADLCREMGDDGILTATKLFYFMDEDWPTPDAKVWQYVSAAHWWAKKAKESGRR